MKGGKLKKRNSQQRLTYWEFLTYRDLTYCSIKKNVLKTFFFQKKLYFKRSFILMLSSDSRSLNLQSWWLDSKLLSIEMSFLLYSRLFVLHEWKQNCLFLFFYLLSTQFTFSGEYWFCYFLPFHINLEAFFMENPFHYSLTHITIRQVVESSLRKHRKDFLRFA